MAKPERPKNYTRIPPSDELCPECWRYGRAIPVRPGPCPICEQRSKLTHQPKPEPEVEIFEI